MTMKREHLEQENARLRTIVANYRKEKEQQEEKNKLEHLIAFISRLFVNGMIENTDELINSSLASVGEFTGVDRCYFFLYDHDKSMSSCTHEWCAAGISSELENLQEFPNQDFPWWTDKIFNNEIIQIGSLEDLPHYADAERKVLGEQSIQSLLVIPVFYANVVIGFLGFDSVRSKKEWIDSDIVILRVMAEIFAGHFNNIQSIDRLRKSEEKYRLLMESTDNAILVIDESGVLHYVNHAACRDFEESEERLTGSNLHELFDDDFANRVLQDVQEVIITDNSVKKEYYFYYKSVERWYDVRIQPLLKESGFGSKVMIIANDVHDHKTNELRLEHLNQQIHDYNNNLEKLVERRSRENMELININKAINEASGALLISTGADGIIESFNPMAEKVLGYKAKDVIGRMSMVKLYAPEVVEESVKLAEKKAGRTFHSSFEAIMSLNEEDPLINEEVRYISKSGIQIPVLLSKTPVKTSDGSTIRYVCVAMDISLRKRAEAELKLQNELKSRFVAMASHEFRTPLSTILMAADSLDAYISRMSDVEIHQRIGRIKSNVEFLKNVMEKVLDLSQIESGQMNLKAQRDDFAEFFKKALLTICRQDKSKSITFNSQVPRIECLFDRQMMKQVISNLLSNALKYSGQESGIAVNLYQEDGNVVFTISDQGIGIPDEDASGVFDYFHRGSNVGSIRGTGLGLPLAREFMRLHEGDITFSANAGNGTVFTVFFPVKR